MGTYPNQNAEPGYGSTRTATPRKLLLGGEPKYLPRGVTIDGAESRDLGNTGDTDVLRAGVLLGKITASGRYAPSIIDALASAYDGGTSLTIPAAAAAELVRRTGSSGTLVLTGPPEAAGTVRSTTVTYSAVDTGTGVVTVTAVSADAVWTLTPVTGTDGGTFKLRVTLPDGSYEDTADITFSATGATFQASIDAAIEALSILPDTAVTVASTDTTGVSVMTFLDSLGAVKVDLIADALTDGGVYIGAATLEETTAGVDGNFAAGSFVQASDGSYLPRCIVDQAYGIKVTDQDDDNINVELGQALIGGIVDASQIVEWPSDASLQTWIKDSIRVYAPELVFDSDYEG